MKSVSYVIAPENDWAGIYVDGKLSTQSSGCDEHVAFDLSKTLDAHFRIWEVDGRAYDEHCDGEGFPDDELELAKFAQRIDADIYN